MGMEQFRKASCGFAVAAATSLHFVIYCKQSINIHIE